MRSGRLAIIRNSNTQAKTDIIDPKTFETLFTHTGYLIGDYIDRLIFQQEFSVIITDADGTVLIPAEFTSILVEPYLFLDRELYYDSPAVGDRGYYFMARKNEQKPVFFDYYINEIEIESDESLHCVSAKSELFSKTTHQPSYANWLTDQTGQTLLDDSFSFIQTLAYGDPAIALRETGLVFGILTEADYDDPVGLLVGRGGQVLLEQVRACRAVTADRLVVSTTAYTGLMDTDGGWLVRWPNPDTLNTAE